MKAMRKRIRIFGPQSQEGAALIIAIMILLILTVLGIYAMTTSTLETKIAGSERSYKVAFYTADAGEPVGINIIKAIIQYVPTHASDLPAPWDDIVQEDKLITSNEIFTDVRDADKVSESDERDVEASGDDLELPEGDNVKLWMDIDRITAYQITGGATEYGSGYEGIGQGGGGEVGVIYVVDSLGQYALSNTASELEAGYLYMVGVPGGE